MDRNSSNAYIWSVVGGAIADQASPTIINFAGLSNPGATPNINAVYSKGVKYWLVDGFSIAPVLYSEDGQTALTSLTGGNISSSRIGKDIVEFNNKRYYITTKGNTGAGIEVYDISGGDLATAFNTISPSTKVYTSAFNTNANANANGITHIETHVDNLNNEVHVLSGSTNNGFEFVKIPGNRSGLDFSSITSHFDGSSLTELDFSANSNRGFSMNSTHAYVAANSKAWYFDHSDPNATGTQLSLGTAVTQGFYGLKLADVFATDNGILGSNIAGGNTAGANFDVYRWADNTADPDLIISFDNGAHRLGDHINFVGDPQGNGTLYAMAQGGNTVYIWDMANGTITDQANPTTITFADLTNAGNYPHVQPVSSDGVDYLLVNGTNMPPTLYSADGQTKLTSISSDAIGNRAIGGNVLELNNKRYLIVTYVGSEGTITRDAGALVYDISGYDLINAFNAISVNSTNLVYSGSYGDAVNGNQAGDVQFVVDNCNDDNVYILSGAANNGFEILSTGGFSRGLDFDSAMIHFDGSVASSTLPPELGSSGDNERGFSFNSTHVYVADKGDKKVYFWDHSNQSSLASELKDDNNVVSGGVFVIADVVATENGIIASNMNWSGGDLNIYRWADNDSSAEKILTYTCSLSDGSTVRYGDQINFVGDPQGNGHLYVMAFPGYNSITNNNYVLVWDMVDGVFTDQANPTTITFADLTNAGNYPHVQPVSSDGVDYLLVNGTNMPPTLYSADGQTKLTSISSDAIGNRAIGGNVLELNNKRYLIVTYVGSEGTITRDAGALVYDISGYDLINAFNAISVNSTNLVYSGSYGDAVNGNQAGDVQFVVDNCNDDNVYILSGAANNGFEILSTGGFSRGLDFDSAMIHFDGSVASSTLPPELGSSGDNERGFSFNSTHVYVADKGDKKVYFWDHSNQSSLASELKDDNNVVSGGVFVIADVVATENGIIASNMNWSGGDLNIYRWADNDSSAEKILTYTCSLSDGSTVRYGDQINFVGDPQGNGHLYVMAFPGYNSITNNNYVLVWDMVDGVFTDQANPTTITFADLTNAGNYPHVQPVSSDGVDYLLVNGTNMPPTLYSADGQTKLTSISSDAIGNRAIGGNVLELNNKRYLIVTYVGSEGTITRDAGALVYDISGYDLINAFNAISVNSTNLVYSGSYGDAVNGNQAGDVQFVVDNCNDDNVYILSGAANNGFEILSTGGFSRGLDFDSAMIHFDGSVASSTLPPELGSSGDNERGFSFNSTHVYVADKGDKKVYFWDHSNQSSLASELKDDNNVVSGGVFVIADVVATENGIIASNMNWSGGDLNIYRWADNDSSAEKILTYTCSLSDGSTVRYGDQINFVGDPQGNGHLYVMAFPGYNSITNNNYVLVWDMVDGVFTDQSNPERIDFTDMLIGGNYSMVQPITSDGNEYLLVNGAQITPTLYSTDGQEVSTPIPSDAIGNRAFGVEIVEFNYSRYLVLNYVGTEGGDTRDAGVLIYDISGGTLVESLNSINKDNVSSKLIFSDSYGQEVNGNQAGDVKTFIDSSGENLYILSGATNNGFRVLKASKSQ